MLKHVNSEISILRSRHFYKPKLVFDSKPISGFKLIKKISGKKCGKTIFQVDQFEKTANLSQNCPKSLLVNLAILTVVSIENVCQLEKCRSAPARHAANPFHKERHPNAQGKTQTLTRLLTKYF